MELQVLIPVRINDIFFTFSYHTKPQNNMTKPNAFYSLLTYSNIYINLFNVMFCQMWLINFHIISPLFI